VAKSPTFGHTEKFFLGMNVAGGSQPGGLLTGNDDTHLEYPWA
jgi:hypothetical protein